MGCLLLAVSSAACVALPPADVAISIASSSEPAIAAGTLSYAITVTDTGPGDAAGLVVLDRLPDGMAYVSASGVGWMCSAAGQDVTCLDPALAVSASSQLTLVVTAPAAGGAIANTVVVSAATPDTVPANNIATATTTVDASADLEIALRDSSDPVPGSRAVQYSIDVTNLGPSPASGVTVTNQLPASGVMVSSATGDGWTCAVADHAISCTRPALTVGVAPPIVIALDAPGAAAMLVDSATVAAMSSDHEVANNAAAIRGCSRHLAAAVQSSMTVLHVLTDADGVAVRGALTEVGGRLYGLAGERGPGGSPACSSGAAWNTIEHTAHCPGSLFSLKLDGSDFRVDHAFSRLDDVTGQNADGYHPYGSLSLGPDGRLHGVTQMGGTPIEGRGVGVAFAFDPATGGFTTDHEFYTVDRAFDGEYPMGATAVLANGTVAGTAKAGGQTNTGTVWLASAGGFASASLTPDIGTSYGGVALGRDGLLHGTTYGGGANNAGTYFTVDPTTLAVTVVDSFAAFPWNDHGTDNTPIQVPTPLSDGTLVAAREFGGPYGTGQLVALGPTGITVLKQFDDIPLAATPRFSNETGGMPNGQIVEGPDGMIYGTTAYGGANGSGSLYRIARDGTRFELLYSFDGGYPYGGLTLGSDGALYGTTFNSSQVFRFVPPTACQ
ncbi:MAG TPA: choice-of-anchor tandem repeat GloVer-containing protein [Kofleriaceae bacterium]|nr:choice-of-anchor tandem repeat GloVer-containing protein [Kofleriaceae bacterium]